MNNIHKPMLISLVTRSGVMFYVGSQGQDHQAIVHYCREITPNADAKARQQRSRGLRPRPRLHGYELLLSSLPREARDDRAVADSGGARGHLLRYRGGV